MVFGAYVKRVVLNQKNTLKTSCLEFYFLLLTCLPKYFYLLPEFSLWSYDFIWKLGMDAPYDLVNCFYYCYQVIITQVFFYNIIFDKYSYVYGREKSHNCWNQHVSTFGNFWLHFYLTWGTWSNKQEKQRLILIMAKFSLRYFYENSVCRRVQKGSLSKCNSSIYFLLNNHTCVVDMV